MNPESRNFELMNKVLLHPDSLCKDLHSWLAGNGGAGLKNALSDIDSIIPTIQEAGLRGLGGGGFPAYKKWQFVAQQPANPDKYLICNGNEDEPGTFKDAYLLSHSPNQVIEGALIAALANNINKIVFYINPEQKSSLDNIRYAVEQWQDSDFFTQIEILKPIVILIKR